MEKVRYGKFAKNMESEINTIQCFDNVVVLIVHDRIPSTNFTIKVNHD